MADDRNDGFEELIEHLVRELAINDFKNGLSIAQVLERIEPFYERYELAQENEHDEAEHIDPALGGRPPYYRPMLDRRFQERVWDTLIARDDVLIGEDAAPQTCTLSLSEAEALPEKEPPVENIDPALIAEPKSEEPEDNTGLQYQPRLHVTQVRLWKVLTGHKVDKGKLPFSEWQLLLAIAAAGPSGILQAEARNQTGQDKRSVPRRTDFLAQKGYIEKKQVLAFSQKTSLLTHKMFLQGGSIVAEVPANKYPDPSKLSREELTQDLKPVPGHEHWTGMFVDTEMVARAVVAIVKAWNTIRRSHILDKMNIHDLRLRKTLERTIRKLFEIKVLKKVQGVFKNNPKIFKDCVTFIRDPTEEEWGYFKKKLTSQGFKNRPSRAKPKSEHKKRVRKGKKRKVEYESSSDFTETDSDSDDFFLGEDDDEEVDVDAEATKIVRTELRDKIMHALTANPGSEGVSQDDLHQEVAGLNANRLAELFPLVDPVAETFETDIKDFRVVREKIYKAGSEIYQYYLVADFMERVREGQSVWTGAGALRVADPQSEVLTLPTNVSPRKPPAKKSTGRPKSGLATTKVLDADNTSTPGAPAEIKGPKTPKVRIDANGRLLPYNKPRGRPRKDAHEIKFTSWEQMRREEGIPGVYTDIPEFDEGYKSPRLRGPPGWLKKGRPRRGCKGPKLMLCFKSARMKDLDWTEKPPKPHIREDEEEDGEEEVPETPVPQQHVGSTPRTTRSGRQIKMVVYNEVDLSADAEEPAESIVAVTSSFTSINNVANGSAEKPRSASRTPLPGLHSARATRSGQSTPHPQSPVKSTPVRSLRRSLAALEAAGDKDEKQTEPARTAATSVAPSGDDDDELLESQLVAEASAAQDAEDSELSEVDEMDLDKDAHDEVEIDAQHDERSQMIDDELDAAANVMIPDAAVQLPVVKDGVVGNLCLDMEKTNATFYPMDNENLEDKLEIAISSITNVPEIEEGTNSFIIVHHLDDEEDKMEYAFRFSSRSIEHARKVVDELASACPKYKPPLPAWAYPIPNGGPKPFRCDMCDGQWKNYEGIKYHKTKAKSQCNPDWVPPAPGEEGRKGKRKGYVALDELPEEEREAFLKQKEEEERRAREEGVLDDDTPRRRQSRKRATKEKALESLEALGNELAAEEAARAERKRKKREMKEQLRMQAHMQAAQAGQAAHLQHEASAPSTPKPFESLPVSRQGTPAAATPEKRALLSVKTKLKYPVVNDRDNVDRRTGPLVTQRRKDIILELLSKYNNVFPGDQGLWFAFHKLWMEKYPDTVVQDYKYCNAAVALLEDQGCITKLKFSFRDNKGRLRTRSVITIKGVDPTGPEVTAIKEHIKASFPRYWCPPEFSPPDAEVEMLAARESRPSEEERRARQEAREREEAANPQLKKAKEAEALIEARIISHAGVTAAQNDQDDDGESSEEELAILTAPFYAPDTNGDAYHDSDYRSPARPVREVPKQKRSESFRAGQSARMKDVWAQLKNQSGTLLRNLKTHEMLRMDDRTLVVHVGDELYEAERSQEFADQNYPPKPEIAPAVMQDAASGAWNFTPTPGYTLPQPRLPEPITYMQNAVTSAWSVRPFGHGALPIFARPSKRFGAHKDLSSSESSFRPVLIPQGRLESQSRQRGVKRARERDNEVEAAAVMRKRARDMQKQRDSDTLATFADEVRPFEFKPVEKPRYARRQRVLMWEWSLNPGLDSLVHHLPEYATVVDSGRKHAYVPIDPALLLMGSGTAAQNLEAVDKNASLFSMGQARFLEKLPRCLDDILNQVPPPDLPDDDTPIPDYVAACVEFDAVAAWEQSPTGSGILNMGKIADGSVFINHNPYIPEDAIKTNVKTIIWPTDSQFTLESLPYDLIDSMDLDDNSSGTRRKPAKRTRYGEPSEYYGMTEAGPQDMTPEAVGQRTRRAIEQQLTSRTSRVYRRFAQTKDFKKRRLTSLPMDVNGLVLPEDDEEFRVDIAYNVLNRNQRRRTNDRMVVSSAFDDRLMVSVVVIRTLLGGLDLSVDWVLVSLLFPQCTLNWLRRHWNLLAEKHSKRIERLQEAFQEAYLEAYAADEVPRLDYDDLLAYDWAGLVDWTMHRTQLASDKSVVLPRSRERFDELYSLADAETRVWRDSYFSTSLPVHKRIAHAAFGNFTVPASPDVKKEQPCSGDEEMLRVARSWARANTLTPAERYDMPSASTKLRHLPREIIGTAIEQLLDSKVIMPANKGRPAPGRGYEGTDALFASLTRHLKPEHFAEAINFKTTLDVAFRKGESVPLDYAAGEGTIMAITNLQAAKRVVVRRENVPANKFGLTDGNYQTKQMDKSRLLFDMFAEPSEEYVFDDYPELKPVVRALNKRSYEYKEPPKLEGELAPIPLWYGIDGELIEPIWKKVVGAVLVTIMGRPGISASDVARLMRPAVEEWEVELWLEWARGVGAVRELSVGEAKGWTVGEWWWWVAGHV